MVATYRIVHEQYFDEKAVMKMEHWRVQQWKRGLFGLWHWRALGTHDYDGVYMPTQFASLDEARHCIEQLQAGVARNKWVARIVETV